MLSRSLPSCAFRRAAGAAGAAALALAVVAGAAFANANAGTAAAAAGTADAALLAPAAAPSIAELRADRARNIVLPQSDLHYRETQRYIEDIPDADYVHATAAAHESFRDIKFSVRIIWGLYSKWGIEASWPFLNWNNEKRARYNELYKTFNPVHFDADGWMDFFSRCGMQAFAFICKHHDGFAFWHTKTRVKQRYNYTTGALEPCDIAYSIEDTPFKRDIVKELCDAARKRGIKIDLYFSHPDWYDADFRPYNYHPLATPDVRANPRDYYNAHGGNRRRTILTPERTPEETARLVARHREQIHELLTNYGPIEAMCLDQWLGRDNWPHMRETVKLMRKWAPNTLFRARGIGNYGDYFQPEQFVPGKKENTGMPWMSICLLAKQFSYDPNPKNYKGTAWVVRNLVDCVAKGGSFMVCLGPDELGRFHPKAVEQLEAVGAWLRVNGEAIYNTTPRKSVWREGAFKFTLAKDAKHFYALTDKWPENNTFTLTSFAAPPANSKVFLLGYDKPLEWKPARGSGQWSVASGQWSVDSGQKNNAGGGAGAGGKAVGAVVTLPAELADPARRPCKDMWAFKFTAGE
ncbi:MAG: alpha-L-fucosidase [Puniceicoccales bacterium]|jgi:alpha-L-fucosidase|nr:alpha-L-fucosidase [Puniceicoccales bacterium]